MKIIYNRFPIAITKSPVNQEYTVLLNRQPVIKSNEKAMLNLCHAIINEYERNSQKESEEE